MKKLKYFIIATLVIAGVLFYHFHTFASYQFAPTIQRGDIQVATSTTQMIRLPTSTVGSVLSIVNGFPKWVATSTLGFVGGSGLTSFAGMSGPAILTATGTAGNIFNISTSTNTITFNLPLASASNTGQLSATDWSTFNNKQATISVTAPITLTGASVGIVNQGTTAQVLHGNAAGNASFGAIVNADITNGTIDLTTKVTGILPIANGGTATSTFKTGSVIYYNGTTLSENNPAFFWNNGSQFLGIGTSSPWATLTVQGKATSTTSTWLLDVASSTGASYLMVTNGGNVGIGTTTPGQPLVVVGSTTITSLTVGNVQSTASGALFVNGQTGTGLNVLQTSPTIATTTLTGSTTISSLTAGCVNSTSAGALFVATCASGGSGNSAFTIGNGLIYNATSTDLVGIGTITPTTTLFVQGKGGTNPFIIASSTGTALLTVNQLGQTLHSDGVLGSPSISFASETGLGFYRSSSGILSFAVGGAQRAIFSNGSFQGPQGTTALPGLSFSGGSGNGLSATGFTLSVSSNGVQRELFDAAGFTGINSSTPTATLVVQGYTGSTTPTFIVSSSTGLSLFQVNANGNAGVGTSTPAAKLVLQGTSGSTIDYFDIASSTGQIALSVGPSAYGSLSIASTTMVTGATPLGILQVYGNSINTLPLFALANSSNQPLYEILTNGHIVYMQASSSAPTITGGTCLGICTDSSGTVTVSGTSFNYIFNISFTNKPKCFVSDEVGDQPYPSIESTTSTKVSGLSPLTSDIVNINCNETATSTPNN